MAEIIPTPATGGYTIVTPQGAPWTPQPATGGYTIITPQGPDRKRRGFYVGIPIG